MGRFAYVSTSGRQPEPEEKDIEITITTPDEIRRGDTLNIEVTLRTLEGVFKDFPTRDIRGEVTIVVGGAQERKLVAVGLTNANYVFKGKNVLMTGGHAEFVPVQAGTYTFAPGEITVTTSDYPLRSIPKQSHSVDSTTIVI
ncbi:hypothetical protein ACN28C_23040 [Plantactinospora sp. WMMC1484]|uniref:hypothetical protein n=1 Tax=Plantactinospora sp. WMMC1484 TaxID=3404122 RepID=UPI003BF5A07C